MIKTKQLSLLNESHLQFFLVTPTEGQQLLTSLKFHFVLSLKLFQPLHCYNSTMYSLMKNRQIFHV